MEKYLIGPPGKKIFVRKYGSGKNKVVFFHGFPGSSIQGQVMEPIVDTHDLEVFAFDRPGYGRSDWQEDRHLLDVRGIIETLMTEFNLKRFSVVGISGGAPYALATMSLFQQQIEKKKIICGLGQLAEQDLAQLMPKKSILTMRNIPHLPTASVNWVVKKFLTQFEPVLPLHRKSKSSTPQRSQLMRFLFKAAKRDIECLNTGDHLATLNQSLLEAFAQGARGPLRDMQIYTRPWKFNYAQLPAGIEFHHGTEDFIVPAEMSIRMQHRVNDSVYIPYPQEGHYSLAIERAKDWWSYSL